MRRSSPLSPVLVALSGFLAACGGPREPAPLTGTLPAPGLANRAVMVFPLQLVDLPGDPEAELVFALENRRGTGSWTLPGALREAMDRSPTLDVPLDDLPVGVFLRAEVRRVGDPLYGIIRRAAAVTDADWALIPVAVRFRPGAGGGTAGTVAVTAAVVDVLSGRVLWIGTEEGDADTPEDPAGAARAMEALAARLLPGTA